jgi:hypothetical protein
MSLPCQNPTGNLITELKRKNLDQLSLCVTHLVVSWLVRYVSALTINVLVFITLIEQAMIRLDRFPMNYEEVKLKHCGLLFLSTPHSGSNEANWNRNLLDFLDSFLGNRSYDMANILRSFNEQSTESKEAFGTMSITPPFVCLYETRLTVGRGGKRHVRGLLIYRKFTLLLSC